MPPERFAPDDPREWLNRARCDLALARMEAPGIYLEDLCFHAQQAVEKALKVLLIHYHVAFPYVHDLARLLTLLDEAGEPIPDDIRDAAQLTSFAVLARYPGIAAPISHERYKQGISLGERVVRWAEERLLSDRDDKSLIQRGE